MKQNQSLFKYLFFLFIVTSCKKENNDRVSPSIQSISIFDANGNEVIKDNDSLINLTEGNYLLKSSFSDDIELKQARFQFSNNFSWYGPLAIAPYSFIKIINLSGDKEENELELNFSEEIHSGPYKMQVDVIDERGNTSEIIELDYLLTHSNTPVLTIDSLSSEVFIGDSLVIYGKANSNAILENFYLRMYDENDLLSVSRDIAIEGNVSSWTINPISYEAIEIDSSIAKGEYTLLISISDTTGNLGTYRDVIRLH